MTNLHDPENPPPTRMPDCGESRFVERHAARIANGDADAHANGDSAAELQLPIEKLELLSRVLTAVIRQSERFAVELRRAEAIKNQTRDLEEPPDDQVLDRR